ncbi:hypothetical protein [Oceanospirillum phage vB_OliS_GJ44]|nr:hypothetical protein [Oceanospirillum phage vB_OliS_GJ44]
MTKQQRQHAHAMLSVRLMQKHQERKDDKD